MSGGDSDEASCREVLDEVYGYLDAEVSSHDIDRIRHHLEECGPCLRQYDLESALKALIKRSCACEPAPVELRVRIMTQITTIRVQLDS